jgi:hypothetical protein
MIGDLSRTIVTIDLPLKSPMSILLMQSTENVRIAIPKTHFLPPALPSPVSRPRH